MSEIEERIYNDILTLIKDNLRILIYNHDSCLYYFNNYCKKNYDSKKIIDQTLITQFTEEALLALINTKFLYDFREIE